MGATKYSKKEIKLAAELAEVNYNDVTKFIIERLDAAHTLLAKPTIPYPAKEFMDAYFLFYQHISKDSDANPKISPLDARSGKEIYEHLANMVRSKNPQANESDVILAWQTLLAYYPKEDRFYKTQLNLTQISKNLNNLIVIVKQNYGKSNNQDSFSNLASIIKQRKGSGF